MQALSSYRNLPKDSEDTLMCSPHNQKGAAEAQPMVESLPPKTEGLQCPVCRDDRKHFAAEGTTSPMPGEGQHSAEKGSRRSTKTGGMFESR